jgi:plastocyanin
MRYALLAFAVVLAATACSNSSDPGVSFSSVGIADSSYTPDTVRIAAGAGVRWTNAGPSTHSITPDTGSAFGATLSPPGMDPYGYPTGVESYNKKFTTAGTFPYHCTFHANMHGAVVVTP